jgi:hypothetical protein
MASGKTNDFVPGTANEFPPDFASYREEFKAALERSAEVLRRSVSESQQSIVSQLKAGPCWQPQPGTADAALQPDIAGAVGKAFEQAQQLLDGVARASQEAQAVAQDASPAPPSPPAPENPPAPPVNPLEATNVLMSQAVGSLNAAMEAAVRAIDIHPGKAGAWEALSAQERQDRK